MDFNRISGTTALVRGLQLKWNNMGLVCHVRDRLIMTQAQKHIVKCIPLPQNNSRSRSVCLLIMKQQIDVESRIQHTQEINTWNTFSFLRLKYHHISHGEMKCTVLKRWKWLVLSCDWSGTFQKADVSLGRSCNSHLKSSHKARTQHKCCCQTTHTLLSL